MEVVAFTALGVGGATVVGALLGLLLKNLTQKFAKNPKLKQAIIRTRDVRPIRIAFDLGVEVVYDEEGLLQNSMEKTPLPDWDEEGRMDAEIAFLSEEEHLA